MELFDDDEVGPAEPIPTGGYAARPGSGPKGETCKTCQHLCRMRGHSQKNYLKCGLLRSHWTHGSGTDIKAGADACSHWEGDTK